MSQILYPLEWLVAWIMVAWHTLLTWAGLDPAGGWTWVLSIVGLVVVIRTALIPLFVRQIRSSRSLQILQPEIKKIQDKYKGRTDPESRQAMARETMEMYKTAGTNPFASCLPILIQMPIFFALFRVLNGIQNDDFSIGPFTPELRAQADAATIFGAPLSDSFLRADTPATRIIAIVLVVLMTASQYYTQRQLFMKNMPPSALDSPFAKQQKMLMYILPAVFAVSGIGFPLGVIFYWFVTNVFSTVQQHIVIQRMPAPGSPAEKAMLARQARKEARRAARAKGIGPGDPDSVRESGGEAPVTSLGASSTADRPGAKGVARAGGSAPGGKPGGATTTTQRESRQRQQPKRSSRGGRKGR